MELGRYHIEYEPRTTIKGQVLADKDLTSPTKEQTKAAVAPADLMTAPTRGKRERT